MAAGPVARTHRGRLDFLDALRGVAAVVVVIQHVSEQVHWRPALWFSVHVAQLGQLGVMVFFLVSGFIIPVSLERHGNLKGFWVARVFRLYPLYWVSLVAAFVLWRNGQYFVDPGISAHPLTAFLANATMASRLFHQPYAIGLYWTLLFELIFYIGCSVLFVIGWLRYSDRIALVLMAGILVKTYGPVLVGGAASPSALPFIAMVTGTLLYRFFYATMSPRRAALVVTAAAVTGVLAYAPLIGKSHRVQFYGGDAFGPMVGAFLGAIGIVVVAMMLRHHSVPRWLCHLGLVSYSMYLVHPLLLQWLDLPHSPGLAVAVFVAVTVGVATVTYYLIEAPMIEAGRTIVRRLDRGRAMPEGMVTTAP